MDFGTESIRSMSRKITVPLGNPSAAVRVMASRASICPRAPLTKRVEQWEPCFARAYVTTFTGTRLRTYLVTRLPLRRLVTLTLFVTYFVLTIFFGATLGQVCCPT